MDGDSRRTMGLAGATGVGVGAIVGGGILALAGVAFAATGPGAMAAFALNGTIAVITALSFAELSSRFPESGGTYTFAKKVLSVEAAFAVGWVVWFASIVAAVLYAIGFAAFGAIVADHLWRGLAGTAPAWLQERPAETALAGGATIVFAVSLIRRGGGGGAWINISKVIVFGILIAGGLWALAESPTGTVRESLTPFLPAGAMGLFQAMGFTFIALQGFDLIAAVGGEVREPSRTIPRAMLLSLAIALGIYLPLLLVIATVGVPEGSSIQEASAKLPRPSWRLRPAGSWAHSASGSSSSLRCFRCCRRCRPISSPPRAWPMPWPATARCRRPWKRSAAPRAVPVNAVLATAIIVLAILLVLPDVAAAGAAASLIFLVTFALAQGIAVLARRRAGVASSGFRTPLFPLVPIAGGALCLALALFQAVAVPEAGQIGAAWLGLGGVLFLTLFARRARVSDAASEASDPLLVRLRGRRPLVLVPIANPASAASMVEVANAMAAPGVGRVVLLNVVVHDRSQSVERAEASLESAQAVLREALLASFSAGLAPEAMTTVSDRVWTEINRVARVHDCESMLLGLSNLEEHGRGSPLEELMGTVGCDTVVLRAPPGWRLANTHRILVAVGGRGHQDVLRARLIASFGRGSERQITYLKVIPPEETDEGRARARREVTRLALDEARGRAQVEVVSSASVIETIAARAAEHDLVILGLQRYGRRRKLFGDLATQIARESPCAMLMISRRG